jgi:uncharacterized RDD family membrane protein YckC
MTLATKREYSNEHRIYAYLFDAVIECGIVLYPIVLGVNLAQITHSDIVVYLWTALAIVVMVFGSFLYRMLCMYLWNGQTVGKRAYNMRLIDAETGTVPSWQKILGRQLFFGFIYAAFGIFAIITDLVLINSRDDTKSLADLVVETEVVKVD